MHKSAAVRAAEGKMHAGPAAAHRDKAVSAYFPEAEEEEAEQGEGKPQEVKRSRSPLQPRAPEQQGFALNPLHNQLSFPRSRAVLWDRQAVSFPFFIRCRDACPALVLRRSIVAEIVRLMKSTQKHTKLLGRCMSLKSTPEHTVLSNSPLRLIESAYALVLEPLSTLGDATPATGKTNRLLIDMCADPEDVTPDLRTMVNSVLQGMRRPGLFSLSSYLAIRATVQPAPSKAGVAVFEAVLPNIDLRLTRIHPIAFLGTSLANQLLSGPTRTGRTGYLTLNETRKLVPILETDPMLVSIPLVGVWFSDGSVDFGEDGASNLAHPTIWAACIRYLFCTEFKDKASVDDRTFLLVVVGSAGLRYYEVQGTLKTATSALEADHPDSPAAMISLQQPPATVSCVCLDFTVDLPVVEDRPHDSPASSIIARFRPQANVQRIGAFREVMEPLLRNSREDVPLYRVPLPQRDPAPEKPRQLLSHAAPSDEQNAVKQRQAYDEPLRPQRLSMDDGATPVPRSVQPQPSPTPPPRAEFVQPRSEAIPTQPQTAPFATAEAPAPMMRTSIPALDGNIPFAAAAIIASQQEQLMMMQMKLQELQEQLAALQHDRDEEPGARRPKPKCAAKREHADPESIREDEEEREGMRLSRQSNRSDQQQHHHREDGSMEQQAVDDVPEDVDPSEAVELSVLDETFVTNIHGHELSSLHLPGTSRSPMRRSAASSSATTPSRSSSEPSPRDVQIPAVPTTTSIPRTSVSTAPAGAALPWAFEIPRIHLASEHDASTFLESPTLANLEAKYLNDRSEVWRPKAPQPRQSSSPPQPNDAAPEDERLLHSVIRQLPKL